MSPPLEIKALGLALLAGSISLGGAFLAATPIKLLMSSGAPQAVVASQNPAPFPDVASTPELVEQGHQFFTMSCSECHGDDAHGDEGPDLHNLAISNASIAARIKKGVKGEMPSFAKKYNDAQVAALISYLRSLH
jgi:mono/diheme cytochrome c family protein